MRAAIYARVSTPRQARESNTDQQVGRLEHYAQQKGWVLERTLVWISHNRRMGKDYKRLCATGEAFVHATMARPMMRRLTCTRRPSDDSPT
jgi:predicted site-specific integrase-resolvase